jgi:beta-lactamase class A
MKRRTIRLRKSVLINSAVAAALLAPLGGDALRANTPPAVVTQIAAAPVVTIDPDNWKSLASAIRKEARRFSGVSGYVIKDLHTGQVVSSGENLVFASASLIKLPILCAAFQAAEEGRFSLTATHVLERADRRGGSGILKFAPVGTVLTNRELLELMIVQSDNTATELVVKQLGIDYLQQAFYKLGLDETKINADGFRLTGRPVRNDNMTSPRDMAFLLEKIYQKQLVSTDASEQMLDILKHQHLRDRLPRYMPAGWQIAHKTGLLRKACHDVGIVFTPQGDYMICVLTASHATYKTAKHFIADMGRITFDYYQGGLQPAIHRPVMQSRGELATGTRSS